jgi:hypothetical protein
VETTEKETHIYTMFSRDIEAMTREGSDILEIIRQGSRQKIVDLLLGARSIGSGQYNRNYVLARSHPDVVMRVSCYDAPLVQSVSTSVLPYARFPSEYEAVITDTERRNEAIRVLGTDAVRIKNTFSKITNALVRANACPHFVYMYGEADVKGFYSYVGESRAHMGFRRYNNVSFHERFDTDLHTAIAERWLDDDQLRSVIFQVLYALMTLQHYLPGFRHNDLNTRNVLLRETNNNNKNNNNKNNNMNKNSYVIYTQNPGETKRVAVPDLGVFAAVADFDMANAPVQLAYVGRGFADDLPPKATLENSMVMSHARFDAENARDNIRNVAMPTFDAHHFLYHVKRSARRQAGTYKGTLAWIDGLGVDFSKRYATQHAEPLMVQNLLASDFFAFPHDPDNNNNNNNFVYAITEVPVALAYLGDEDERMEQPREEVHPPLHSYLPVERAAMFRLVPGAFCRHSAHFVELFYNRARKPDAIL